MSAFVFHCSSIHFDFRWQAYKDSDHTDAYVLKLTLVVML